MKSASFTRALQCAALLSALLSGSAAGASLDSSALANIDAIVQEQITAGRLPGAVVLVGQGEQIVYQRAFGRLTPAADAAPVQLDTVFDIASLTKPVATASAILQLAEQGKLALDAPVARYWPAFASAGKAAITVRQLLTHSSGLRPDLPTATMRQRWRGHTTALRHVLTERPRYTPGTRVDYSDLNFVILGELVRRISGQALDRYASDHVFAPLGMADTGFRPDRAQWSRIAPVSRHRQSPPQVHDPLAQRMGGVAGHAGLYSTAADLARYVQMLLRSDAPRGVDSPLLSPESIRSIATPQTPLIAGATRSLGWRLDPPLTSASETPLVSHYGYTGTAIWIDFSSATYAIALSNRVAAPGGGDAMPLRKALVRLLGEALQPDASTSLGHYNAALSPPS